MAGADFESAPKARAPRFPVFLERPWAKGLIAAFAVLLVWWLAYSAVVVFNGTKAPLSSVVGDYSSNDGARVSLSDGSGRYYLASSTVDFSFSYDAGLLSCASGSSSFLLRYLSDARLFDYERHAFLGRVSS